MRYLFHPRQASGLVRRGARVGSRGLLAPWHPGMPPRPLLDADLLSHTYPPKHPPHCSLSQQGFVSLQLELSKAGHVGPLVRTLERIRTDARMARMRTQDVKRRP